MDCWQFRPPRPRRPGAGRRRLAPRARVAVVLDSLAAPEDGEGTQLSWLFSKIHAQIGVSNIIGGVGERYRTIEGETRHGMRACLSNYDTMVSP